MSDRESFEVWWQSDGKFCRSGGGDYEKTFAYSAWQASRKQALEEVFKWMEKRNETHQYMNECVKLMKKDLK